MTQDDLSDRLFDLSVDASKKSPHELVVPILALAYDIMRDCQLPTINGERRRGHTPTEDPGPATG